MGKLFVLILSFLLTTFNAIALSNTNNQKKLSTCSRSCQQLIQIQVNAADDQQQRDTYYAQLSYNAATSSAQSVYDQTIASFNEKKVAREQEITRTTYEPLSKQALDNYRFATQSCGGDENCKSDAKSSYNTSLRNASEAAQRKAAQQIDIEYQQTVQNAKNNRSTSLVTASQNYLNTLKDANDKFNTQVQQVSAAHPDVGTKFSSVGNDRYSQTSSSVNRTLSQAQNELNDVKIQEGHLQDQITQQGQQQATDEYNWWVNRIERHPTSSTGTK